MKRTRALLLIGALMSAGVLEAGLSNATLTGPASVASSQVFTLVLNVQNSSSTNQLDNVSASLGWQANGMTPVLSSGPSPATVTTLLPFGSAQFTWLLSGTGCGSASFSATVSASEGGTPVSLTSNAHVASLYCTPTPTPTATPNVSPTATPWVIYATATPVPPSGWAGIPGNLYHPLQGVPLQLKAALPEAARLSISIYDRLGRKVKGFSLDAEAGLVTVPWDGRSDDGITVATGIYVAQFTARGFSRNVKFAVIK